MKINEIVLILATVTFISACGGNRISETPAPIEFQNRQTDGYADPNLETLNSAEEDYDLEALLDQAEQTATADGRAILVTARTMIRNQEIVLGSCWDYIDAVFKRANIASKNRITVFKSVKAGPFADAATLQAGDWLYFINHSYGDVEHSSVFVAWVNEEKKEALMISYAGGNRQAPARYKSYDLSSVYMVIRPKL